MLETCKGPSTSSTNMRSGLISLGGRKVGVCILTAVQRLRSRAAWNGVSAFHTLPYAENSNENLECECQHIPLPCPPEQLLPLAPAAPAEAPVLVEGAIIFDSWVAVISENVVMTKHNVAKKKFGLILACNYKKSIFDMYEPAGRQDLTF